MFGCFSTIGVSPRGTSGWESKGRFGQRIFHSRMQFPSLEQGIDLEIHRSQTEGRCPSLLRKCKSSILKSTLCNLHSFTSQIWSYSHIVMQHRCHGCVIPRHVILLRKGATCRDGVLCVVEAGGERRHVFTLRYIILEYSSLHYII